MKPKVIVISMSPYEDTIVRNHYFKDSFEKDGYRFEYWSICKIVGFDYTINETPCARYFSSINEIVSALRLEKKAFLCNIQISLNKELYPIFKAAAKYADLVYEIKYLDGSIAVMSPKNKISKFHLLLNKLDPKQLIKRIQTKLFLIKYHRSNVKKQLIQFLPPNTNAKKELEVHHFDYIINQNEPMKNISKSEKFIVFLDQGLPSHPDFKHLGRKNIDKKVYLERMNLLFKTLEERLGYPVVIAAHPKSSYSENDFGGREIIKYHSSSLSKNAEAVLFHYSTAFNYAILNNKPMVGIIMNEFLNEKNQTGLHLNVKTTEHICELFNAPLINIDHDLDKISANLILTVDKHKYEDFKNTYLISQANKELSNYEIVKNRLLK
ncbi:hypothetical protein ACT724_06205 [Ornithobacterium rhinotracheale]|uniref:hypothetical protein n=1 Tax=Ornithobacterium rhinotracheale TaxID=28251 RepID=UPI00403A1C59